MPVKARVLAGTKMKTSVLVLDSIILAMLSEWPYALSERAC